MFLWLLHNAVLATLLAAGVSLLCRWKRVGPALRHALWVLVLVRLLLPPGVLTWPWRLPLPTTGLVAADPGETGEPAVKYGTVLEDVEIAANTTSVNAPDESATLTAPAEAASIEPVPWRTVLWWTVFGAWAAGAVVVAAGHLRGFRRLLQLIRLSEAAPRAVMKPIEELARELGIRTPRVRVVSGLTSPVVGGLLKPVLLWPSDLHNRLPYEGLKAVLVHELAHLRRRDHWVRWLEMAGACLWWWNPLFRLARQRVRCYAELACDAWVLTVLPRARRAYAEALLQVCESATLLAEPAPALGINGDKADIERRLTMIMRESVACRVPKRWLLAIGLLALLAIPGWSLGDPPAPTTDQALGESFVLETLLLTKADESEEVAFEWLDTDIAQINQAPDREERLARLETQIEELLKEIKAIKAERGVKKDAGYRSLVTRAHNEVSIVRPTVATVMGPAKPHTVVNKSPMTQGETRASISKSESVMRRVTYSLPASKGKALAQFLAENVKGAKIQCSVDGDKFIVMTTREILSVVDNLVQLVAGLPATRQK